MENNNEEKDRQEILRNFPDRPALYNRFDLARQREVEVIANELRRLQIQVAELTADLEDEKITRQGYRKRATDAENILRRNQFVLVLVDGDGYIFNQNYLRGATESGGAKAAHDLCTEVHEYLRSAGLVDSSSQDMEVMINVYANRAGLAKALQDADIIQHQTHLDLFFQSFVQCKALFHFIDCGHGKERTDAKLRDAYRFFAYNAPCKHIFLACCHDNGYVAELEKYRHDHIAEPKTILVQSTQMGRGYETLNFPRVQFKTFNTNPLPIVRRETVKPAVAAPQPAGVSRIPSSPIATQSALQQQRTEDSVIFPAQSTWSTVTASNSNSSSSIPAKRGAPSQAHSSSPAANTTELATGPPAANIGTSKGIPVNRQGQRIDLKLVPPPTADVQAFDNRSANHKLCNHHHLTNNCNAYPCRYDHEPIDARMRVVLRFKARSIACLNGPDCRDAKCVYGHHCPWGNSNCLNPKCGFLQKGMHNITDLDVAKHVPAVN